MGFFLRDVPGRPPSRGVVADLRAIEQRPLPAVCALLLGLALGLGTGGVIASARPQPAAGPGLPGAASSTADADPGRFEGLQAIVERAGQGQETSVAIADLVTGAVTAAGPETRMRMWSLSKVPVAVAYLRAKRERAGDGDELPLTAQEQELMTRAITESDNDAIRDLTHRLIQVQGAEATREAFLAALREGGAEPSNVPARPQQLGDGEQRRLSFAFGIAEWTPVDGARFFRALSLGCLLEREDNGFLMKLLREIAPDYRRGAVTVFGDLVHFKGGVGPNPTGSYTVSEVAIVGRGADGFVLSVQSSPTQRGRILEGEDLPDDPRYVPGTELLARVARGVREAAGAPRSAAPIAYRQGCP